MNGVHDMGGMDGMGPIEREADEPVFHEPWEGRVYAIATGIDRWGIGRNWTGFRFEIESIPAAEYLRISYYEKWFTMIVNRLLKSDLVTQEELESAASDPSRPRPTVLSPPSAPVPRDDVARSRFSAEQEVRVRNLHPRGHTRLPRYVRGKLGTVVRDHGLFVLQDTDEEGQPLGGPRQPVYTVRFAGRELWGERASANDSVYVELWEDYLEPE